MNDENEKWNDENLKLELDFCFLFSFSFYRLPELITNYETSHRMDTIYWPFERSQWAGVCLGGSWWWKGSSDFNKQINELNQLKGLIDCWEIKSMSETTEAHMTHLNMKMNRINSEKKIATLSIVRSMTNNCRRRFGMNRTSFRILSNRNVRNTDSPEFPLDPSPPTNDWHNSTALEQKKVVCRGR